MKILVTGSKGFIGNHLLRYLEADGSLVYGLDALIHPSLDLSSPMSDSALQSLTSRCDGVFHLAGTASRKFCQARPAEAMGDVVAAVRVLEACYTYSVPCIVASSAWVYPDYLSGAPRSEPFSEGEVTGFHGNPPSQWYSYIKLAIEDVVLKYRLAGSSVTAARFFNVYGPDQEKAVTYPDTVVTWLIRHSKRMGRVVTPPGEWRDFVYIEDVVAGLVTLMKIMHEGRTVFPAYNLGWGFRYSLSIVARMIANTLDIPLCLEREDSSAGADIQRMKSMGWKPEVDLETGIRRTVEAMK